jgi:hypothetical protein
MERVKIIACGQSNEVGWEFVTEFPDTYLHESPSVKVLTKLFEWEKAFYGVNTMGEVPISSRKSGRSGYLEVFANKVKELGHEVFMQKTAEGGCGWVNTNGNGFSWNIDDTDLGDYSLVNEFYKRKQNAPIINEDKTLYILGGGEQDIYDGVSKANFITAQTAFINRLRGYDAVNHPIIIMLTSNNTVRPATADFAGKRETINEAKKEIANDLDNVYLCFTDGDRFSFQQEGTVRIHYDYDGCVAVAEAIKEVVELNNLL